MIFTDLDPIWESKIYSQGNQLNLYPYDSVVSFVFRHRPRGQKRQDTKIIEVGCGAGNNLWFAAREGFQVSGIDGSASAIAFAKQRFKDDNLYGDIREGSFLMLPWDNNSFDLGIDRGSLVCVGFENQKIAVAEMHRILKPGGLFLSSGYTNNHTSANSGTLLDDGRVTDIKAGTLVGVGALCFNSKDQEYELFEHGWDIISFDEIVKTDLNGEYPGGIHSEWRVVARKQ